jgi:DNA repair protein RadC
MDKELTRDVAAGARLIGIKLLDHVILGDGKFYSMADHGEII